MSGDLLGFPFDIHTGGIDHREIHHPNEIAQNQAHCDRDDSGARIWMHNNFLIDRTGKMSKSSGAFLRLQTLVDRGFHPLSYRLMCLQAHYRSELEFSWENLLAAQVRLKRMVMAFAKLSASGVKGATFIDRLEMALFDDLNTAVALTVLEEAMAAKIDVAALIAMAEPLGLDFLDLDRSSLRVRPGSATLTEADIEARLDDRKAARAAKDFATSDRIRDELTAGGVEVMDGDPLGWDWKPVI
jgi:cysteinyl-tRNA synthetase